MLYEKEKDFIITNLKNAYNMFCNEDMVVEQKSGFDLVTSLDKKIEKYIIDAINEQFPSDTILSEELNPKNSIDGRVWTIDPIDGTCNMAHGSPIYGLQCSLIANQEIVLGIIYLPMLNELYYAIKGEGAYVNDNKLTLLKPQELNNAIISVGDFSHGNEIVSKEQLKIIDFLRNKIAKIRMYGSACYDFAFSANSRIDGTIIITSNKWDLAPGLILCKEVGLFVTNTKGEEFDFNDNGVVVSNSKTLLDLLIASCNN